MTDAATSIHLVRHAKAQRRDRWWGRRDRERPLTKTGLGQSKALAVDLGAEPITRILTSPFTRCVQTVEPLADKLGREVIIDDRLFEGVGPDSVESLLSDLEAPTVFCTHGDVVPMVLQHLVRLGMRPERELIWEKASVWVAEREDGTWTRGRYLAPPVD